MTKLKVELRNHQKDGKDGTILFCFLEPTDMAEHVFFLRDFCGFFQVGDQETFYNVLYVAALMERF